MEEKEEKNSEKIQTLREMIYNAEKTLQGAKAMLLQLEGKKKVGRKRKMTSDDEEEGKIVEGSFDGQIMIGADGKQYPVPANYASKSKLVEGDHLKLTITPDGSFIYKQIGPVERKRLIGIVSVDPENNYFIAAEGKAYKVLLASITYFKVEPGDEVTLVIPRDIESDWGSIENVIQKGHGTIDLSGLSALKESRNIDDILNEKNETEKKPRKRKVKAEPASASIIDEWTPDLEELKKELSADNTEPEADKE